MDEHHEHPAESDDDSANLRRWLADAEAAAQHAPDMTRDESLLRLADQLPEDAFASIHLAEVALTNRHVASDIRAGMPAKFSREWTVLITAPGYSHCHGGDQLAAVVEQALADYHDFRTHRDAEAWTHAAIPDVQSPADATAAKPPKLTAPGTAEERTRPGDAEKDVG